MLRGRITGIIIACMGAGTNTGAGGGLVLATEDMATEGDPLAVQWGG
ncbi:MAG TPA: hypothetical protein VIX19_10840 [Terriglobales bacterium]